MERRIKEIERGQTEMFEDYLAKLGSIGDRMEEFKEYISILFERRDLKALKEERDRTLAILADIKKDYERGVLSRESYEEYEEKYASRLRNIEATIQEVGRMDEVFQKVGLHESQLRKIEEMVRANQSSIESLDRTLKTYAKALEQNVKTLAEVDSRIISEFRVFKDLFSKINEQEASIRRLRSYLEEYLSIKVPPVRPSEIPEEEKRKGISE
jgi:chromosome segregation ATPase